MRVFTRYRAVRIALLFTLFFSCEEPEPYFNKKANPPEVKPLILDDLTEGQHVTGTLIIEFIPEIPITQIDMVSLSIDDQVQYGYGYPGPFVFQIDTKLLSEGEHTIVIGVHEKGQDLGLLNLANIPATMYTVTVYIDHQSPTPVVLQSVEWNNELNTPQLTWTKNNDLNFYAYIIHKEEFLSGIFVDTVYDQDVTTYLDFSHGEAIGISCTYRVIVWNRDQQEESNALPFSYPAIFPLTVDDNLGVYPPIESADGTELFTLTSEGVKAVSLTTNAVQRTYPMPFKYPKGFALSKDGARMFVLSSYSPEITVLNASTFEVLNTADIDGFDGKNIICGRPDRLYITTSSPFSGPLIILNADNLQIVGELAIEAPNGLLDISTDNAILYVADMNLTQYQSAKIYSIDISTDTPSIIYQKSASDEVRDIELSADDETLFVIHDYDYPADMNLFVDCWEAATLTSYRKLSVPDQAFTVSVNAQTLCVAYGKRYLNHWDQGGVLRYDISSGALLEEWKLKQAPYECLVHSGNQNLYVFGFNSWVIPLSGF